MVSSFLLEPMLFISVNNIFSRTLGGFEEGRTALQVRSFTHGKACFERDADVANQRSKTNATRYFESYQVRKIHPEGLQHRSLRGWHYRHTLYPQLIDHELVHHYPHVRGFEKNVFFFTHNHRENGGGEESASKFNMFEVCLKLYLTAIIYSHLPIHLV